VNVAHAYLLDRAPNATRPSPRGVHVALALLTFTAVVFRSEVVLLVASLALQALVSGWTSFPKVVSVGLVSGLCSVCQFLLTHVVSIVLTLLSVLTVLVDSYFWGRWPLWPELYAAWFNVYEGKSSEWGVSSGHALSLYTHLMLWAQVSPVHAYLTSALPKLLLTGLPLAVLGILADGRIRTLVVPSAVMVAGLSVLPHKEWRFVVYAVPVLNVAAAKGACAV
jgi:alpha-1,6-mannosyltransferase